MLDVDAALKEIDDVLARCGASKDRPSVPRSRGNRTSGPATVLGNRALIASSCFACIERNAPRPSYVEQARQLLGETGGYTHVTLDGLLGVLVCVRQDLEAGYVRTLEDRARDALSDDLLETASSIAKLNPGAAIVLAVSVLEEHIRKLAAARGIATHNLKGGHRSFEDMTADLQNAEVFGSSEKRLMGGWYAQRTSAAHGRFKEVTDENAPGIIDGVRNTMVRHPA